MKKDTLKFDADWINELIKKCLFCVFKSFAKNYRRLFIIKIIMYIVYCCLQNDKKIFEKLKIKIKIRNNILKFYKIFVSLSYFSLKFNVDIFNFI